MFIDNLAARLERWRNVGLDEGLSGIDAMMTGRLRDRQVLSERIDLWDRRDHHSRGKEMEKNEYTLFDATSCHRTTDRKRPEKVPSTIKFGR